MEQIYKDEGGEKYDPVDENLELAFQRVLQNLPQEQGDIIFQYVTEMTRKDADLNDFFYRKGLRDGLNLNKAIQNLGNQ